MKTFCRIHNRTEKIIGWDKDDPILACGIVKRRTAQDDAVNACRSHIERLVNMHALEYNMSIKKAREVIVSYLLGLYCLDRKV